MWPFSTTQERSSKVNYRQLDKDYAVSGQVLPTQIPALAEAGFKTIICARPDNEDYGQPSFAEVASAAEAAGMKAVHVPVAGAMGQGTFIRFERAMKDMPKPVLSYCRSGGRAASLYTLYKRG